MSAPDTNVEKQARQHRPALIAIGAALVFGALIAVLMMLNVVGDAAEAVSEDSAPSANSIPAGAGSDMPAEQGAGSGG